jgi:hypothetical protein
VPRKPLADETVQTSVRLPRELYDQLVQVAGERGTSTEIRRRLEMSLSGEAPAEGDKKTRELLSDLARAARKIEDAYGPWHEDEFATEIFALHAESVVRGTGKMPVPRSEPVTPRAPQPGSAIERALRSTMLAGMELSAGLISLAIMVSYGDER